MLCDDGSETEYEIQAVIGCEFIGDIWNFNYAVDEKVYFFEPLEKEISVEDMQKIVDANEKLIKELKDECTKPI
mgnify:CR=1 FL=1